MTYRLSGRHFPAPEGTPCAARHDFSAQWHGIVLDDPWHWLRAANWQEAMREPSRLPEEIKAYLEAENTYYETAMADTRDLQEQLIAEMRGRIKEDETSVPVPDGPFAYSWKHVEGGEHPIRIRTTRDGKGGEEVLLDVNAEAIGKDYFQLGLASESPDHSMLAWSRDTSGAEYYSLVLRDLGSLSDSAYEVEDVGSAAWLDNRHILYTRVDENHRPSKVFRHEIGTDPSNDALVYEEADPRFFCGVSRSRSGDYVFIIAGMNDQDEIHYIPTVSPLDEPRVVEPRAEGVEYGVEHQDGRFLILTNVEGAEDFKIMEAPLDQPSRANWRELVAHRKGRTILSLDAYRDWIIWMERENALPRICFMDARGEIRSIAFREEAYSLAVSPFPEFESSEIRFTYSSPTTPAQVFDYDLNTGERVLRKEQEIPSGHDPDHYVTRRIFATSHDGEEVPITLLHHRDTPIDASAPCLLYGYGSYGMSMPAGFAGNRLSLVDRGFVYAIAHVRGGEEKGRAWYEAAKFAGKPNTFRDFIAAAEKLVADGFAARDGIVIQGGSAGGLLVGACVNMRPDLFAGVIADVPFVDVLNTILDDGLPLTPGEWTQWGNPIESREMFDLIRSYSPYDNVEAKDYPPMLVTAGVSDPRVTYWEPAKWVAKLRSKKTDGNALILRTNMSSGHFGKSGRFAALEDAARSQAFAIKVTGASHAPGQAET